MTTSILLSVLASAAIVQTDGVALRATAADSAAQHAALTQGDLLEVRGTRLDYLQVYDHRRERAGYVKASSVRKVNLDASQSTHFLSVVRFLKDSAGQEALGIGYAQSYLKISAGPSKDPTYAEVLEGVGKMAERMANRASKFNTNETTIAQQTAQLEGVAFLGVRMTSIEQDGQQRLCYDGKAYQQLMGLNAPATYKLTAALALTKPSCIDSRLSTSQKRELDAIRLSTIEQVPLEANGLTALEMNRWRHRKAAILASLSFGSQRVLVNSTAQANEAGSQNIDAQKVARYAAQAIEVFSAVDKTELSEVEKAEYDETAVRVGAIRWAALPAKELPKQLSITQGEPGQTCLSILSSNDPSKSASSKRCTFGVVWVQSLSISPNGQMMSIAVQPTETWREVWLLRKVDQSWVVDVLPPNTQTPHIGLIEFAGWVPADTKQEARILVARDVLEKAKIRTTFEVLNATSLNVDGRANHPQTLFAFAKFQQAAWRGATLTVR
jgi:hypothetical protein